MNTIAPDKLEGSALGKYQILTRIGSGNMASVYMGHDPFIDRPVAVKVARPDYLLRDNGEFYKQLFFNEAQTAGLLKHPNITSIYDAGVDRDFYYIVMEYVHGGRTLERHTTPARLLSMEAVTRILYQCAMALDYAHKKQVVHRDIKPRNILLTDDSEAKITDFGVAIAPESDGEQCNAHAGSPLYMSPEQVQRKPIDGKTDLFSLGVVAYELLTGHHPFRAENMDAIRHRIVSGKPVPLVDLRADTPAIYQRIVDKALAKNPAQRYQSGLDMAGDISLVFDFLKQPAVNLTQQEKYHRIENLGFFKVFPDGELWELINAAEWVRLPAGDEVVREGSEESTFFVLIDGNVGVYKQEREIVRLHPGDCFGEMGMISRRPRSATIRALDEVTVMRLKDSVMERMSVNCQLKFQRQFLRVLIERLEYTTDRVGNDERVVVQD